MKSTAQAVQGHLELDWIAASQGPLARPGIPQFHLKTCAVMRPGLRLWGLGFSHGGFGSQWRSSKHVL